MKDTSVKPYYDVLNASSNWNDGFDREHYPQQGQEEFGSSGLEAKGWESFFALSLPRANAPQIQWSAGKSILHAGAPKFVNIQYGCHKSIGTKILLSLLLMELMRYSPAM